ncbi:hypothetical protein ECZU51_22140 [Escherichia coli]|nr:hypothetical protein ECZU51_22140 [Escherichia coli]
MFRRLLIATVVGILAAFAVAGFRHAMLLLEWLFLNNDSGSLVNAATNLSPATAANSGARRTGGGFVADGLAEFTQQRPHAPTDYMEALQTDGQFDYAASLVKSLASLLVVTSGSAIGREGAMILLAALAASCFAQRFTPRRVEIMDRLWSCGGNGCGLSRPACWQFIYSRSAVWHYDVGLSRPGDYFRRRGVAG